MNRFLLLLSIPVLILGACNKQEKGIDNEKILEVYSPNGQDIITDYPVIFKAKDGNGTDVTAQVSFLVNGQVQNTNTVQFAQTGTYQITAQLDLDGQTITSVPYQVNVQTPRHSTKVMIEDYTGTWCPNCPRVTYKLDEVVQQNDRIIPVAIHYSRWQGDDPFGFDNVNTLTQDFNITAFPSPLVNRTQGFIWDETLAGLQSELNRTQALGLAIQSQVNGNDLEIKVKVRFDLNMPDNDLNLVVYITENNLHADQVNATQYYGGQNPIPDFEQNHTLRTALNGLYGIAIPESDKKHDQIFTYIFNNAIPTQITDIQNCEIVAFVINGNDQQATLVNVQKAAIGTVKDFD